MRRLSALYVIIFLDVGSFGFRFFSGVYDRGRSKRPEHLGMEKLEVVTNLVMPWMCRQSVEDRGLRIKVRLTRGRRTAKHFLRGVPGSCGRAHPGNAPPRSEAAQCYLLHALCISDPTRFSLGSVCVYLLLHL